MAPTLAFAKPHSREGTRKKAGAPSSRVRDYRVDDELSRRSAGRNQNSTTRVIVTLVAGAKMPTEMKRYLHRVGDNDTLDLINGMVLDLPNGLLKQMEASL